MRNKNTLFYVYTGVTGFGFIPQGPGDGGWTNLRPLHTEGQGLTGGGTEYKKIGLGIPLGVGYKIGLDPLWRISFELSYTQTFTDYLDDVSKDYVDPGVLADESGALTLILADRSKEQIGDRNIGVNRGNTELNDWYYFAGVSITFILYKPGECKTIFR